MVTYLNQLKQIGVSEQRNGVLLGTFTAMEKHRYTPVIGELVKKYAGSRLPVAQTRQIGHGTDAWGIVIGESIRSYRQTEAVR